MKHLSAFTLGLLLMGQSVAGLAQQGQGRPVETGCGIRTPVWEWIVTGSSIDFDRANAVERDNVGNLYLAGAHHAPCVLRRNNMMIGEELESNGTRDAFLIKYNKTGQFQWSINAGGPLDDEANDIAVTAEGIYVTGYFRGTATFPSAEGTSGPSINLTSMGNKDIFPAKYSASGVLQWAYGFGGPSEDEGFCVAFGRGNVYIVGGFRETATFMGAGTSSFSITSQGNADAFMAWLTPAGVVTHAYGWGSPTGDYAYAIDAGNFNPVVAGGFTGTMKAQGSGTTMLEVVSRGDYDGFVARFGTDGLMDWIHGFGGTGFDVARGVNAQVNNAITTTGGFRSPTFTAGTVNLLNKGAMDIFVTQHTYSGNKLWARSFGGPLDDEGRDVVVLQPSHLLVTGYFQGTASDEANRSVTSLGNKDVLVWNLGPQGRTEALYRLGGVGDDQGYSIIDEGCGVAVAGLYSRNVFFNGIKQNEAGRSGFFMAALGTQITQPEISLRQGEDLAVNTLTLEVYPNPVAHHLTITLAGVTEATEAILYDIQGRPAVRVMLEPGVATRLDVSALPRGLYVIKAGEQTQRLTVK